MNIDLSQIKNDVHRALQEDLGNGDVTAELLPAELCVEAEIITREPMLVCGQDWVNEVIQQVDKTIKINWQVTEGQWLNSPQSLCHIIGNARSILTAERTALNFLQTLSATATQTYHYVQKLKGSTTRLLDTRKTLPGLRLAQKYAVRCAGGINHRIGLYDAFLIKENHITSCGSIKTAVELARQAQKELLVEIEVENLEELKEALDAKPDRILLDNFSQEMLIEAVKMNRERLRFYQNAHGSTAGSLNLASSLDVDDSSVEPVLCTLEASGGITLDNIAQVASSGVDFISVGAITKSIQAIDLSLLVRERL